MQNKGGNHINFAEAARLPILARGRIIKNSMSVDIITQISCNAMKPSSVDHVKYEACGIN